MRFSFILFLSLIFGCGKGDFKGFTNGQLTEIGGAPISGAEIHVSYPGFFTQYKTKPTAYISFNIPEASQVSLKSYRFGSSEFIETLVDKSLPAGSHGAPISDSLYTNGMYSYKVESDNFSLERKMFLVRNTEDLLDNVAPLAFTDNSGDFSFQTSILGIDEILSTEISSFTVPSLIEFIAIKNGEIIARKTVRLSNGIDNEVSLVSN